VTGIELLTNAFDQIRGLGHSAVDGLNPDQLNGQIADDANTVSWLLWHLARVQDDHVADVAGTEQVWTSAGWAERFDLPLDSDATGYGHSADEVTQVRVEDGDLLTGYLDAVTDATLAYLETLTASDLDRVVDESYDPPVTLGVRLLSVVGDDLQHVGQAAFASGLVSA
jgi:uncharacterized damage-inducible protein DinB